MPYDSQESKAEKANNLEANQQDKNDAELKLNGEDKQISEEKREQKPWTIAAFGDFDSDKRATLTKISELYGKKHGNDQTYVFKAE